MPDKNKFPKETLQTADCPGQVVIPTPKEKEALDAMRFIKDRVRIIKKRSRALEAAGDENDKDQISEMDAELARLKSDWNKWEKKWKEDVKERMIVLGHDEA